MDSRNSTTTLSDLKQLKDWVVAGISEDMMNPKKTLALKDFSINVRLKLAA